MPKEKKLFDVSQFTATKYESAEEKVKFCEQFVKFLKSGFARAEFPKWFYTRLSMTFGHIAHYSQDGFYETFFTSPRGIEEFIRSTLKFHACGHPEFTYCDAEQAIQQWMQENPGDIEAVLAGCQDAREQIERKLYEQLHAKYGGKS